MLKMKTRINILIVFGIRSIALKKQPVVNDVDTHINWRKLVKLYKNAHLFTILASENIR